MAMRDSIAVKTQKRSMDEWEIRDAASTLIRAEEIRSDKALMKLVNKELKERQEAILKVTKK